MSGKYEFFTYKREVFRCELHQFQIICIIHKFIYHRDLLPKIYHNYFTENFKIHEYNTRYKENLHLTVVNLCYGSKAINFKGCNFWNQLPEDLKHIPNAVTFKQKLKKFLQKHIIAY